MRRRRAFLTGIVFGSYFGWKASKRGVIGWMTGGGPKGSAASSVNADKVRAVVDLSKERARDVFGQFLAGRFDRAA
jgi:hypothetical protein